MNEYLNLVVAKSSQDHHEQLQRLKQEQAMNTTNVRLFSKEKESKLYMRSKFLRELKSRSALGKNSHREYSA